MIGIRQLNATISTFGSVSSPNQRMKIGMKLIFGIGNASETSGSTM